MLGDQQPIGPSLWRLIGDGADAGGQFNAERIEVDDQNASEPQAAVFDFDGVAGMDDGTAERELDQTVQVENFWAGLGRRIRAIFQRVAFPGGDLCAMLSAIDSDDRLFGDQDSPSPLVWVIAADGDLAVAELESKWKVLDDEAPLNQATVSLDRDCGTGLDFPTADAESDESLIV